MASLSTIQTELSVSASEATADVSAIDRAVSAGIYEWGDSESAPVADINGDGLSDFFFSRHKQLPVLYENQGGRFTATTDMWARTDRHDCAWADVNVDGHLDLYCSTGAEQGSGTNQNELWIQQGDGSFVEQAVVWGVTDPYGRGRRVTFLDVNHDPYPDLYVTNQSGRTDGRISANRLFVNEAGSSFRGVPQYGIDLELGGGRCAEPVDYDADGWQDIFVCGGNLVKLFRNLGGTGFVDVTASVGLKGKALGVGARDLDGDLDIDLILVRQKSVQVRLFNGSKYAAPFFSRALTKGAGLGVGDVNADGRLDIYVVQACNNGKNVPDMMLIGHRTGGFVEMSIPQAPDGCGWTATPIDFDVNGTTDFIVLNAAFSADGPIQLISFE
jgi:hypothetical protein